MTPRVADALDKSIAHWERVIEGEDRHIGWEDCALCGITKDDPDCRHCPLAKYGMACDDYEISDTPTEPRTPWTCVWAACRSKTLPEIIKRPLWLHSAICDMYVCLLLVREAERS